MSSELAAAGAVAAKFCVLGPQPGSFHPDAQYKLGAAALVLQEPVENTSVEEE